MVVNGVVFSLHDLWIKVKVPLTTPAGCEWTHTIACLWQRGHLGTSDGVWGSRWWITFGWIHNGSPVRICFCHGQLFSIMGSLYREALLIYLWHTAMFYGCVIMCCMLSTFHVSSWIVANISEPSLLFSQKPFRPCWRKILPENYYPYL